MRRDEESGRTPEEYWFVGEDGVVVTGEQARAALSRTGDAAYVSEGGKGIVRVSHSRWLTAQEYERRCWMERSAEASNDRNDQHFADFGGYRALRGMVFGHAIELGCGPFTNLRLIGRVCKVHDCTLLDPLIDTYLHHSHVMYDRTRLQCAEESALARGLSSPKPLRGVRRVIRTVAPSLLVSPCTIPIRELIAHPVEEMPTDKQYDLIVIINVLEHCYDVELVLRNILAVAAKGSMLVFHETCHAADQVA